MNKTKTKKKVVNIKVWAIKPKHTSCVLIGDGVFVYPSKHSAEKRVYEGGAENYWEVVPVTITYNV